VRGLILLLAAAATAWPQVAERVNQTYESPEGRERMIGLLSSPDRADNLEAEKLIASLDISDGATVVDLGTGAGFLLPFLSDAVGPDGKVIAQDIYEDFLEAARQIAASERLPNVEFLFGDEKDPRLPEGGVALIIAVDAYHHFNYPAEMLAGIRHGLKSSGRLAILEYHKSGFADSAHIRLDKADLIREIVANGFRLISDEDHIPGSQYLLQFTRNE